jgi:hypothetical protein
MLFLLVTGNASKQQQVAAKKRSKIASADLRQIRLAHLPK